MAPDSDESNESDESGACTGTPRSYPIMHTIDTLQIAIEQAKTMLHQDIVTMPEVSFNFFRESILPLVILPNDLPISEAVDLVYNQCIEKSFISFSKDGTPYFTYFFCGPLELKGLTNL